MPVRAVDAPDIVYLNGCAAGCSVEGPATDDAVNGKSSIVVGSHVAPAFPHADAIFDATAACVRTALANYNIEVRIVAPGAVPRREVLLTTLPSTLGFDSGVPANAPFDGTPRENTLGFVFASTIGSDVDDLCWLTVSTIGSLYGLDYVTPCGEIMSNSTGCGEKAFLDQDSACVGGVNSPAGKCILGNSTQNSDAILLSVGGVRDIVFENGLENFQLPSSGPAP
jgi:hypothetical protein